MCVYSYISMPIPIFWRWAYRPLRYFQSSKRRPNFHFFLVWPIPHPSDCGDETYYLELRHQCINAWRIEGRRSWWLLGFNWKVDWILVSWWQWKWEWQPVRHSGTASGHKWGQLGHLLLKYLLNPAPFLLFSSRRRSYKSPPTQRSMTGIHESSKL